MMRPDSVVLLLNGIYLDDVMVLTIRAGRQFPRSHHRMERRAEADIQALLALTELIRQALQYVCLDVEDLGRAP
jgi:hypothetical protein